MQGYLLKYWITSLENTWTSVCKCTGLNAIQKDRGYSAHRLEVDCDAAMAGKGKQTSRQANPKHKASTCSSMQLRSQNNEMNSGNMPSRSTAGSDHTSIASRVLHLVKTPLESLRNLKRNTMRSTSVNKQTASQSFKLRPSWSTGSLTGLFSTQQETGDEDDQSGQQKDYTNREDVSGTPSLEAIPENANSQEPLFTPSQDAYQQDLVTFTANDHVQMDKGTECDLSSSSQVASIRRLFTTPNKSQHQAHPSPPRPLPKRKGKKPNRKGKGPDHQLYCYPDCINGRKYDRDLIQCCICMLWVHEECAELDKHESLTWNCKHCRKLPETLIQIKQQMLDLQADFKNITSLNENLITMYKAKCEQCEQLVAENAKLKRPGSSQKTAAETADLRPSTSMPDDRRRGSRTPSNARSPRPTSPRRRGQKRFERKKPGRQTNTRLGYVHKTFREAKPEADYRRREQCQGYDTQPLATSLQILSAAQQLLRGQACTAAPQVVMPDRQTYLPVVQQNHANRLPGHPANRLGSQPLVQCFSCGGVGHKAFSCPTQRLATF